MRPTAKPRLTKRVMTVAIALAAAVAGTAAFGTNIFLLRDYAYRLLGLPLTAAKLKVRDVRLSNIAYDATSKVVFIEGVAEKTGDRRLLGCIAQLSVNDGTSHFSTTQPDARSTYDFDIGDQQKLLRYGFPFDTDVLLGAAEFRVMCSGETFSEWSKVDVSEKKSP